MKIRKGDNIIVLSGKDRGKGGTVLRAFPKKDMVLVEGINIAKKHQKARRQGQVGQVIERPMPIHVSNVAIKDPKSGKASRVSYKVDGEKKTRVAVKSGASV